MKVTTTAQLDQININGKKITPSGLATIDLEFSAIDTGGGFHDPMLAFDFTAEVRAISELDEDKDYEVRLFLQDPNNSSNEITLSYLGRVKINGNQLRGMARLKEGQLEKKAIAFVMKCFRFDTSL